MSDLTVLPVTVEHHREPLGIGERRPRLSWVVAHRPADWRQAAYELEIEPDGRRPVWSSGRVDSAESVLRAVGRAAADQPRAPIGPGAGLGRGRRRAVGVERGRRRRGRAARAGGLVGAAGAAAAAGAGADRRAGAALLRREFVLDRPVVRARLYATAHGVYEAELNGAAVGDQVLAPGWTSYDHRLRYQTYDVTDLLREGANAIGVHAGRRLVPRLPRLRRQAERLRRPHRRLRCSWRSSTPTAPGPPSPATARGGRRLGPLTRADIYNGETFDARRELTGWSTRRVRRRGLDAGRGRVARRRHAGRADRPAGAAHPDAARCRRSAPRRPGRR